MRHASAECRSFMPRPLSRERIITRRVRMDQQNIPYFAHEGIMARMERTIKRLWVLCIVLIILLAGSNAAWLWYVKGLENEPERGKRCAECFYHRLFATARKAQEMDIPYFATTLASSRWKDLEQINAAGLRAAEMVNKYPSDSVVHEPVQFWAQNWRKDGLQERRNELLKEYNFYNQLFCGCEFSNPNKTE